MNMAELLMRQGVKQKIPKRYQAPVQEFVKVALEKYGDLIERIILFGSVARGEATEESDIDILVVGDTSLEELVGVSFPILLDEGELISAKNMKKDHFTYLVWHGYSFIKNVLQEGVVLYERMGKSFGESRGEAQLSKTSV